MWLDKLVQPIASTIFLSLCVVTLLVITLNCLVKSNRVTVLQYAGPIGLVGDQLTISICAGNSVQRIVRRSYGLFFCLDCPRCGQILFTFIFEDLFYLLESLARVRSFWLFFFLSRSTRVSGLALHHPLSSSLFYFFIAFNRLLLLLLQLFLLLVRVFILIKAEKLA